MCEARPLISEMGLRAAAGNSSWRVFSDGENITLVITGAGPVAAAVAVGNFVKPGDTIVNFGCAGCATEGLFRLNKIRNGDSSRTFYPDVFGKIEGIGEMSCVTTSRMAFEVSKDYLSDMEAAAIYEAGSFFVGPDSMHFLKFVSDSGDWVSASVIEKTAAAYAEAVSNFIRGLKAEKAEEDEGWKTFSSELKLSATMSLQLRQYMRYAKADGIDFNEIIDKYRSEGRVPAETRRDGKKVLDEIRAYLCGE